MSLSDTKGKLSKDKLAEALRRKLDIGQANPYFLLALPIASKKKSKYLNKLHNLAASSRQLNQESKAVLELGPEIIDIMYYEVDEEEIEISYLDRLIRVISATTVHPLA
ncbi:6838_t:CDS:2 [Funneliformis caledonium]|uniref:6838_t:CDS:1 n=1 Tax=Funneliformis caledonium TaxID=1117310 RepID=A0A9N9GDE9_9GLOM|nr:6838_t:CDS:2 [Funneliformis caledonium]